MSVKACAENFATATWASVTFARVCIQPPNSGDALASARRTAGAAAAPQPPRPTPARDAWYAEPGHPFDNL